MAEEEFAALAQFTDQEKALELSSLLEKNNIRFVIKNDVVVPVISYSVHIREHDFEKAITLMRNFSANTQTANYSYYLYDFKDQDLIDLIAHPGKWSKFDFELAQSLLRSRGRAVSVKESQRLKTTRVEDFSPAVENKGFRMTTTLVIGTIAALIIMFIIILIS